MKNIEDQLKALPAILITTEKKITQQEFSKTELEKLQTRLDTLEDNIALRKYQITPSELAHMLELQALLDYSKGSLGSAKKLVKEVLQLPEAPDLTTGIANDIADGLSPTVKNAQSKTIPHYFTVSTLRLVLLSLLSLGLYLMYWSYKNWKAIQEVGLTNKKGKKVKVYPKLSAWFFLITSYELFSIVRNSMKEIKEDRKVRAGLYAWVVFFFGQIFLAFLPVIIVQEHMNHIKEKTFGDAEIRRTTSWGEVVIVLIMPVYILIVSLISASSNTSSVSPEVESKRATVNALTAEYETCSDDLISRKASVNLESAFQVEAYNRAYDECEQVRIRQNAAVDEYNASL